MGDLVKLFALALVVGTVLATWLVFIGDALIVVSAIAF